MPESARHLRAADRAAAGKRLDAVVGAGFWSHENADAKLSFVATVAGEVAGVLLARLIRAEEALPEEA